MSKLYSFLILPALLFCLISVSSCINIGRSHWNNYSIETQANLDTQMDDGMTFSARTSHGYIHVSGTDENRCYVNANIKVRAKNDEEANEIAEKVKVDFKRSANKIEMIIDKPTLPDNCGVYVSFDVKLPRNTNLNLIKFYRRLSNR